MSSASATIARRPAASPKPAFEAFLKSRDEPAWLIDRRREAFARFQAFAWPSSRDEEWRRTDIRALKLDSFAPPHAEPPAGDAARRFDPLWETLSSHYATGIEHVNGAAVRTADPAKLGGAVFLDLDQAVAGSSRAARAVPADRGREAVRRRLRRAARRVLDRRHAALRAQGVKVEAPLFSLVGLADEGRVDFSHTLVVLEEGAEATLVRETAGHGRGDDSRAARRRARGGPGPGLAAPARQHPELGRRTWHFSRERALVGRDAALQWTVGGLGSRLAKVNQEVALAGQGAEAQVNGVMFTTGRQHLAYFTRQDHMAPHTTSDLLYKGGLKDRSRIVWKGMIRVEKDAQRTDAYQKNDNLVLSESARADSIPGLEIEANDVRCTHGATAGRVDEEMIFYSQARGIPRETAIRLIVEGFFANVYDRITLEPVRETLRQAVAAKLGRRPR